MDEAWRHCDIGQALLALDPNPWVLGLCFLDRGCVAASRCEFENAAKYFHAAIDLAETSGSTRTRYGAEINIAYVQTATGEFADAETTLNNALEAAEGDTRIHALDFLARVHLAAGNLERCEQTLNELDDLRTSIQFSVYAQKWVALTKAKLLIKQHRFDDAARRLTSIEIQAGVKEDRRFMAAVHLLSTYALYRTGHFRDCARQIISDETGFGRQSSDVKGQLHFTLGMIVDGNRRLAETLRARAGRIWTSQGTVSARAEIQDGPEPASMGRALDTFDRSNREDVGIAINVIASAVDLANQPRLLGAELLSLLETTAFATNAAITEAVDGSRDGLDRSGKKLTLRLGIGSRPGKSVVLSCDVPASPADALTVADIFHIGRTVLELEKARQEERSRAALWPADPIEMQAGVLFIAEEMQTVLDTARRVAAANIPVLITGETGTGKEVLARLIHNYSPRATKTFLPFNCTATPRDMLDSQLFGHRRGAFTGAMENFSGVIRAASGGTLFLDEIGESTLDIQPKLLRFLESGEVHPIGDTHPQRVDVRVIAATNADVDMLVSQGRFREDLFYRLNIVRLHMPPLRERRVEIPAFANHFLEKSAKEMNKGELRLAEETMEYLVLYRWPGNVRQIANEMRRLAALAERGAVLMPEHLSADIAASRKTLPASERTLDAASEIVVRIDQPFGAAVQHLERAMVQAALASTNSVDEAAKLLGVSRKGLYLKRLRYGMEIDRPGAR